MEVAEECGAQPSTCCCPPGSSGTMAAPGPPPDTWIYSKRPAPLCGRGRCAPLITSLANTTLPLFPWTAQMYLNFSTQKQLLAVGRGCPLLDLIPWSPPRPPLPSPLPPETCTQSHLGHPRALAGADRPRACLLGKAFLLHPLLSDLCSTVQNHE